MFLKSSHTLKLFTLPFVCQEESSDGSQLQYLCHYQNPDQPQWAVQKCDNQLKNQRLCIQHPDFSYK